MAKTTLKCEWSDCTWVSKEASLDKALRLLEIHVAARNPTQTHHQPRSSQATTKPEKAKRPEIASEMSGEDWAYFVSRLEDYKKATALNGEEVIMQLMECCCEQLRRDHHRTYPKTGVGTVTEISRLAELKQLAVKLGTLRQDKGNPSESLPAAYAAWPLSMSTRSSAQPAKSRYHTPNQSSWTQ